LDEKMEKKSNLTKILASSKFWLKICYLLTVSY